MIRRVRSIDTVHGMMEVGLSELTDVEVHIWDGNVMVRAVVRLEEAERLMRILKSTIKAIKAERATW